MKIAVLFDGAGLSRFGLERAGHDCTGFELNPVAHHLSGLLGSGNSVLADVRDVDLSEFDAVWASPPCQLRSSARTQGAPQSEFADDLLQWSMSLPHRTLWVENVSVQGAKGNDWGTIWNAAQFAETPRQARTRVIGGRYYRPRTFREFRRYYPELTDCCPCVTATEYKGCATDKRRASRFYGRRLTVGEAAYRMGLGTSPLDALPRGWEVPSEAFEGTESKWREELYRAIGNGVPIWMAEAFGRAADDGEQRASEREEFGRDLFTDLDHPPAAPPELTTVIHMEDSAPAGSPAEKSEQYIGRLAMGGANSGEFGNPFPIGPGRSRALSIIEFRRYFLARLDRDVQFREAVLALRGKRLVCFCAPNICHGDVIAEFVNDHFGLTGGDDETD